MLRPAAVLLALTTFAAAPQPPRELRWAGDPEGGAPFVEADPTDASRLVGFDVEIADVVARGTGRVPRFTFVTFNSIDQSVQRGDFDTLAAVGFAMPALAPYGAGQVHRSAAFLMSSRDSCCDSAAVRTDSHASVAAATSSGLPRVMPRTPVGGLIGERLASCAGVRIDLARLESNIVVFRLEDGAPDAGTVVALAREAGVLVMAFGPRTVRAVTHLDVSREDCETAAELLATAVAGLSSAACPRPA